MPVRRSIPCAYLRHREILVQSAATQVHRMQKALVQMNLQLPTVISDITGVTGLRILRDIVARGGGSEKGRSVNQAFIPSMLLVLSDESTRP